jgi:hypothetical protein
MVQLEEISYRCRSYDEPMNHHEWHRQWDEPTDWLEWFEFAFILFFVVIVLISAWWNRDMD